jgi:hypothetical protein
MAKYNIPGIPGVVVTVKGQDCESARSRALDNILVLIADETETRVTEDNTAGLGPSDLILVAETKTTSTVGTLGTASRGKATKLAGPALLVEIAKLKFQVQQNTGNLDSFKAAMKRLSCAESEITEADITAISENAEVFKASAEARARLECLMQDATEQELFKTYA